MEEYNISINKHIIYIYILYQYMMEEINDNNNNNHYDVIVLGAGISGIDAVYYLQKYCPWAKILVLERRENIGGTWDFFKYPGIRSDSDMYTFGFSWKLWKADNPIATAGQILKYLNEAVNEQHIREKIKFNTNVEQASFSSANAIWTLKTNNNNNNINVTYTCNMLFGCTGYYSYENPNKPTFPNENMFKGSIVHPSNWTNADDQSIINKNVAIIGSGATAVTMLPNIAKTSKHVTMVQRSPTYMVARKNSGEESFASKWLPESLALTINRWSAVFGTWLIFESSMRYPNSVRNFLEKGMWKEVKDVMSKDEFKKHFHPKYDPWEQRVCLTPDGDFFRAIREKKASIVTDHIEAFTETGIQMKDGTHVDCDVIVTATGINFQQNYPFSTIDVTIDGEPYIAKDRFMYKGVMISDVPNFIFTMGYANASWTLKADITSSFACNILNHMRKNDFAICNPHAHDIQPTDDHVFGLKSGYVQRSQDSMPKQGNKDPWINYQNYILDSITLMLKGIEDEDNLEFLRRDNKMNTFTKWGSVTNGSSSNVLTSRL